jgi:hypothetical protein
MLLHRYPLPQEENYNFAQQNLQNSPPVEGGHFAQQNDGVVSPLRQGVHHLLCIISTFHLVCFAWIFFRADTLSDALLYIVRIGSMSVGGKPESGFTTAFVIYLLIVLLIDWLCERKRSEVPVLPENAVLRGCLYGCALFLLVFIGSNNSDPFVYFQF